MSDVLESDKGCATYSRGTEAQGPGHRLGRVEIAVDIAARMLDLGIELVLDRREGQAVEGARVLRLAVDIGIGTAGDDVEPVGAEYVLRLAL